MYKEKPFQYWIYVRILKGYFKKGHNSLDSIMPYKSVKNYYTILKTKQPNATNVINFITKYKTF